MKAWHFLKENGRCNTGRLGKIEVGKTYKVKGKIEMCHRGLHGSVRLVDALWHAPGPVLCRVELGGNIVKDPSLPCKVVASERTVLWMQDITETLWLFACAEAERIMKTHDATQPAMWDITKALRDYVKGDITDSERKAICDEVEGDLPYPNLIWYLSSRASPWRGADWAAQTASADEGIVGYPVSNIVNQRLTSRVRRIMLR